MVTVSIIIRTKNRPQLLRRALQSLEDQTFKDFEVVIIEDGPETALNIIEQFPRLQISYHFTVKSVGRVKAANYGLEQAAGKYINFLDDDDVLLPNHIQVMSHQIKQDESIDLVHAGSIERWVRYDSMDPLVIDTYDHVTNKAQAFNKDRIFFQNYFPIQAVMFKREFYSNYGGMDETLQYLEDWDLWIKYSLHGSFKNVKEVTSVYDIPYNKQKWIERRKLLDRYEKIVINKYAAVIREKQLRPPGKLVRLYEKITNQGIMVTMKTILKKL